MFSARSDKIQEELIVPADYLIKGDAKLAGIGAASILAKITCDRQIVVQSQQSPEYVFENHKGYGTKEHMEAPQKLGPYAIHRYSYKPVKNTALAMKKVPPNIASFLIRFYF